MKRCLPVVVLLLSSAPVLGQEREKIGFYVMVEGDRSGPRQRTNELERSARELRNRLRGASSIRVTESPEEAQVLFRLLSRKKEGNEYRITYELDAGRYVARGAFVLGGRRQADDGIRSGFYRQGYNSLSGRPMTLGLIVPANTKASPGWEELVVSIASSLDGFVKANYERILTSDNLGSESSSFLQQHVSFPGEGVDLSGTLVMPRAGGPHPAVVIVHGSGPESRYEYRAIARDLASRGFAVLIYDKRGVGNSTGVYEQVTIDNSDAVLKRLAGDVLAGLEFLKTRPQIRSELIGFLGFSEAGWVIPLAATRSEEVAFTVILSGPAVTVGEEIHYSELSGEDAGTPSTLSSAQLTALSSGYSGEHGFDPLPFLEKMTAPGLWIFGGRDRTMPVNKSMVLIDQLRQQDKPFSFEFYDNADHALFDADSGERTNYLIKVAVWVQQSVLSKTN